MPVHTEHYTNGLGNSAVYALFSDDDDTAVQMTEGSGLKAGIYTASDSAIQSAGLAAGTYRVSVRRGDYSSPSASDYEAFSVPRFVWDGTNEVDELAVIDTNVDAINVAFTVTAEDVDERYTFKFPRAGSGTNAGKQVPVNTGFAGDICFDVSGVIYRDATVASVSSVTVSDSGATVGDIRLHTSKRKFLVALSAVSTTGPYEVAATFTTTDSQTIKVVGTLVVK